MLGAEAVVQERCSAEHVLDAFVLALILPRFLYESC